MTKPCIDIETFTWSNLQADVFRDQHAQAMWLYLESVVIPALDAIEAKHEELLRSDKPTAVFQLNDVKSLHQSTIQAFTLSVQSQWEPQLRGYLKACAQELKYSTVLMKRLEGADWTKLLEHFQELRGLPLQAFDSFPDLELLQWLGNSCRHGDGKSASMLYERRPELWPNWPPAILSDWSGAALPNAQNPPSFSQVSLHRRFWNG
jgi:hypothetical protein